MYRYLFEEKCFDRSFGTDKKVNLDLIKKIRYLLAKNLEIKYEDTELKYYKKTKEEVEVKLEAKEEINKNFVFRVVLEITEKGNTIVSIETFISRLVPVHIVGVNYVEDIVYNIMQEFSKKSFYQDLMAELKLKYEEVGKKIYEDLETLFGLDINDVLSDN
jgi:hypothetical protein